jgi:DNA-binding protein YbaB
MTGSLDERMRGALHAVRCELGNLRYEAESSDGLVWVAVNGYGQLVDLWLADHIYRSPDAAALAATIDDTTRQAAKLAADDAYLVTRRALTQEGLA